MKPTPIADLRLFDVKEIEEQIEFWDKEVKRLFQLNGLCIEYYKSKAIRDTYKNILDRHSSPAVEVVSDAFDKGVEFKEMWLSEINLPTLKENYIKTLTVKINSK